MSQWFLVLGGLALANAIWAINNNFDGPLSWRVILMVAVLIFAAIAYWCKSVYAATIAIVGFLVWWPAQAMEWQKANTMIAAIPAGLAWLAILLYVAGFWQTRFAAWKRFAMVYLVVGLLVLNFFIFLFSSRSGLEMLSELNSEPELFISSSEQNFIVMFAIGFLTLAAIGYGWYKKFILEKEAIAAVVLFLLFGAILVSPPQETMAGYRQLAPAGIAWGAIFNFTLFAEILGVIFAGYWRREVWMVNFGAVLLVLFIAFKYFDWFFNSIDKSAFFIFAGILLFGIGWAMERGRRYLLRSIGSQINQETKI